MKIVTEWKRQKLNNLVSFKTGKLNSNAAIKYGKYPFFTCSQETYKTNTYSFDTECVLLAGNNANGIYPLKYYSGKFDAYQRTYVIEPVNKEILNIRFLFYALKLELERLRLVSTGAATKFLTLQILNNIDINLPIITIQNRISDILSSYDDLIENNIRRIHILEEMAQTIYREWFVNFRFPGHENVRFVKSEKGLIPEGWTIDKLGNHIYLDKGISYNGAGLTPSGLPMVNLKCILPGGGFRRTGTKPYSGDYKPSQTIKPWDIIIANTDLTQDGNIVGSPALIPQIQTISDILITHHIYAVRFSKGSKLSRFFLYQMLLQDDFKGFAKGRSNGTTVLGLPRDGVLDYEFIIPDPEVAKNYENYANSLYKLSENLEQKNKNLQNQRDLLLPKLISGEINLPSK